MTPENVKGFVPNVDPLRYRGQDANLDESAGILLSYIPHGARVLDVGCGTGSVSTLIRDHCNCQVTGLEPNGERAKVAQESGLRIVNDLFTASVAEGLGKFDVIVFADVLEHLVNPGEALDLATTLLTPDGWVVASVPNVAHWTVRLDLLFGRFDYRELGIMDATHLRWFTREALEKLFRTSGLNIVQYRGSAGLWMSEYSQRRPWKWISRERRQRLVRSGLQYWPGLFACQHVVKASPER
jgi:2-polyprenyl-3-methyl-5-hydroxy-6-metoxy-1,4-benzoquinol methylase